MKTGNGGGVGGGDDTNVSMKVAWAERGGGAAQHHTAGYSSLTQNCREERRNLVDGSGTEEKKDAGS